MRQGSDLVASPEVVAKFDRAKLACPNGVRKIVGAYKSDHGKIPSFSDEEVRQLLDCEVLVSDCRGGKQITLFNRDMEELFWRTTFSTLELIPMANIVVGQRDRKWWPWSALSVPSSRKSGPASTRRQEVGPISGVVKREDGECAMLGDEPGHDDITSVGPRYAVN